MTGDQIANIAFLGLLAAAIGGSYIASHRGQMGKMTQQAAIWGLIFIGTIAAIGMWGDIRQTVTPRQSFVSGTEVVLPRQPDGHYYATLTIDGVPVDFVVDTGASMMVLSQADATRIGLDPGALRYFGSAQTANGVVQTAPVRLDTVALGDIVDRDVPAVVNGGQMDGSLLGMSYLSAFASIEIRDNALILKR